MVRIHSPRPFPSFFPSIQLSLNCLKNLAVYPIYIDMTIQALDVSGLADVVYAAGWFAIGIAAAYRFRRRALTTNHVDVELDRLRQREEQAQSELEHVRFRLELLRLRSHTTATQESADCVPMRSASMV